MSCVPGCGRCCDPVTVGEQSRAEALADRTARFDDRDVAWLARLEPTGTEGQWRCPDFDNVTRLCMHEDRPPVCRDYPFYGDSHDLPGLAACSYWSVTPVALAGLGAS